MIDDRLTQVERRCALAHELVHAERRDSRSDVERVELRQEQTADRIAAERLLPLERLIWGLLWSMDQRELAEELNVDLHTLRVRLEHLTTQEQEAINEAVYRIEGNLP